MKQNLAGAEVTSESDRAVCEPGRRNAVRSAVVACTLLASAVIVGSLLMIGCGGAGGGLPVAASSNGGESSHATGTLTLSVKWPQVKASVSGRLIPAASQFLQEFHP